MCIIVKKDAGVAVDYAMLNNCFQHNSDGAGFMFVNDSKVEIHKGYMKWKHLKRALHKHNLDDKEVVFHFRISTGRDVTQGNCHPFALSDDFTLMQNTNCSVNAAVCHNGVMMHYEHYDNYSDTQHFIAEVLAPLTKYNVDLTDKNIVKLIAHAMGGTNKLAIMDAVKGVQLIGTFEKDEKYKGYLFSNTSYETRRFTYTPSKRTMGNDFTVGNNRKHNFPCKLASYTENKVDEYDYLYGIDDYGNWDIYDKWGLDDEYDTLPQDVADTYEFTCSDKMALEKVITDGGYKVVTITSSIQVVQDYTRSKGEVYYSVKNNEFLIVDGLHCETVSMSEIVAYQDILNDSLKH